ncbi:MAG TPA: hypothetical protein VF505_05490, partial [Thermoanaerobaculia bacterium]
FAGSDLNHDGYNEDLAPGHTVNNARGSSFSQVDLRLSKEFRVSGRGGIEAIAEVFNLFNSKNPAGFNSQGVATLHAGDPLQSDQRVIQLGARVHF